MEDIILTQEQIDNAINNKQDLFNEDGLDLLLEDGEAEHIEEVE